MITINNSFLNPQLAQGPVATAYLQSIQTELGIPFSGGVSMKHYGIIEYFYNLSIDTANSFGILGSGELAGIGLLIGYPWPSVFSGDFLGTFQFIPASSFPGNNPSIGFSSALSGITNGTFQSANPAQNGVFVNVPVYRQILKFVAYIKWNKFTIPALDVLISGIVKYLGYTVNNSYTIKYGVGNDIFINFNISTANIGTGWLGVLQNIFNRVCTAPQVNLSIS